MKATGRGRTLLVGIGSPHGDDRAGWLIAEAMRKSALPNLEIRQAAAPSDLLDWLGNLDRLIVCDACQSSASSGQSNGGEPALHHWLWPSSQLARLRSASSHTIGLPATLELAERLRILPAKTDLFGLEGVRFDAFADPSPLVVAARKAVVAAIVRQCGLTERPFDVDGPASVSEDLRNA